MTATQTRPDAATHGPDAGGSDDGRGRRLRPRRSLPGGRAVVGGLLVAVAAVGTFAAVAGAGRRPSSPVVTAARDIPPGTVLTERDLAVVAIDVPAPLRGRVFTAPSQVVGAVAVGPLAAGELVQAGGLAEGADGGVPTLSVAVPTSAANGGRLHRGDTVQVFATYGSDVTAVTRLLAGEARVVGVDSGDAALGVTGQIQVVLAIGTADERSKVINAVTSGTITLVRTTGAEAAEGVASYRPDADTDPDDVGPGEVES